MIAELTLMLLRLTAWDEGKPPLEETRSWKTYDWNTLDALQDMGCLSFTKAAKSVALTGKGRDIADRMIDDYLFIREELPKVLSLIADKHPEIMSELFDQMLDEYKHKAGSDEKTDGHGDFADEPVNPSHDPSAKLAAQRTGKPDSRAFRIRATMRFEELTCWREMLVPANFTFLDLHCLIQRAFLFLDYHLWDFRLTSQGVKLKIDESALSDDFMPVDAMWGFPGDPEETREASETLLSDVFPRSRTALYSYDYGDGWEIKIKVVETVKNANISEPQLLDGEGDAPPEDVGAEWGFQNFLIKIADPKDPEHKEMVEWGESQQFEHFDLDSARERFADWDYNRTVWFGRIRETL